MNRAAPYAGPVRHAPAGAQEDRPPVMRVVGAAAALLRADGARDRCVLKIRRVRADANPAGASRRNKARAG